ncbi:hypothetical protein ACGFYQ_41480 [Streptomyces sp. NPDC048258]|uniref:hypothetical protein n=1 Tax=Streptomyces sp. NPDC048258 TaxID=3365527 RepID=UPI003713870E
MDRSAARDSQRAGTAVDAVAPGKALFLPGPSIVAPGITKEGGMPAQLAERRALMPQFLEPLGLRVVDDIDEGTADER